jgi:hypothetical protein
MRLFRNNLRMCVVFKYLFEHNGVEFRVRVDDLTNKHEILSIESGSPIYRPASIWAQQIAKLYCADEAADEPSLSEIKWEVVQQKVLDLILRHYKKDIKEVSEIIVVEWGLNRATVIEICCGRSQ